MKVLLTDNYSSYNGGDAAILDGMLFALRSALPGAEFTVTSSHPDVATAVHGVPAVLWTPRRLPGRAAVVGWFTRSLAWTTLMRHMDGVRPLDERDSSDAAARDLARTRLARTLVSADEHALLSAYNDSDLVIGVGGAYLRSGYRLTNLRLWQLHLAKAMGKPVMLYAASVGPFTGRRWWPRHVLDGLDAITLRDRPSLYELHRLGVVRPRIELAADAALALPVPPAIAAPEPRPHLGVSVLHWHKFARGTFEGYRDAVARALDLLLDDWARRVTFMSTTVAPAGTSHDASGTSRDDVAAAHDVMSRMAHADRASVWETPLSVADLRARIGGFDLWIGNRMHSCIFATSSGVPTVAIGYEPKVAGYFQLLGLAEWVLDIETVAGPELARLATGAWHARDTLTATMAAHLPELRAQSLTSAQVACELAGARSPTGIAPEP